MKKLYIGKVKVKQENILNGGKWFRMGAECLNSTRGMGNGELTKGETDVRNRWRMFFEGLLNGKLCLIG